MEFNIDCEKILGVTISDPENIVVLDSNKFQKLAHPMHSSSLSYKQNNLAGILDRMGEASAKAQMLGAPITSAQKFFTSENQRLYLKIDGSQVQGLLKVGVKNLFLRGALGAFTEIKPLCVLDFYVHESCQRLGIGKELFERMINDEKRQPKELGYDRPSPKLLAFLAKYYNLRSYSPQSNNFVVFDDYFKKDSVLIRPQTSKNSNLLSRHKSHEEDKFSPAKSKQSDELSQQWEKLYIDKKKQKLQQESSNHQLDFYETQQQQPQTSRGKNQTITNWTESKQYQNQKQSQYQNEKRNQVQNFEREDNNQTDLRQVRSPKVQSNRQDDIMYDEQNYSKYQKQSKPTNAFPSQQNSTPWSQKSKNASLKTSPQKPDKQSQIEQIANWSNKTSGNSKSSQHQNYQDNSDSQSKWNGSLSTTSHKNNQKDYNIYDKNQQQRPQTNSNQWPQNRTQQQNTNQRQMQQQPTSSSYGGFLKFSNNIY
eukprot:403346009